MLQTPQSEVLSPIINIQTTRLAKSGQGRRIKALQLNSQTSEVKPPPETSAFETLPNISEKAGRYSVTANGMRKRIRSPPENSEQTIVNQIFEKHLALRNEIGPRTPNASAFSKEKTRNETSIPKTVRSLRKPFIKIYKSPKKD